MSRLKSNAAVRGSFSRLWLELGESWHSVAYWRRVFILFGTLGLIIASLSNFLTAAYVYRTDVAAMQRSAIGNAASIARRVSTRDLALRRVGGETGNRSSRELAADLWSEIWSVETIDAAYLLSRAVLPGKLEVLASASKSDVAVVGKQWDLAASGSDWSQPRFEWYRKANSRERIFRIIVPVQDDSGVTVAMLAIDHSRQDLERRRMRVWTALIVGLGIFALLWLGQAYWLSFVVGAPVDRLANSARALGNHGGTLVPVAGMGELTPAAELINELTYSGLQRDRLHDALTRYVSGSVATAAAENADWLSARGVEREITILFSDIYQFTELSQTMSTSGVVDMLNQCFSVFAHATHKHNGMIDKFIGDGMMALFGAPVEDKKHAEHAVLAALEMQKQLARLRQKLNQPSLRAGIGINTGKVIVGNIGSEDRIQYTAIGAPVNLASRLESFSRSLGGGIIVGYDTAEALGDEFKLEQVDGARLKGVSQRLTIYKVLKHERSREG